MLCSNKAKIHIPALASIAFIFQSFLYQVNWCNLLLIHSVAAWRDDKPSEKACSNKYIRWTRLQRFWNQLERKGPNIGFHWASQTSLTIPASHFSFQVKQVCALTLASEQCLGGSWRRDCQKFVLVFANDGTRTLGRAQAKDGYYCKV